MILRSITLMLILASTATGHPGSSRAEDLSFHDQAIGQAKTPHVEVAGIDPENLAKLSKIDWPAERWAEVLTVAVKSGTGKTPLPVSGKYRVVGRSLWFEPRFPFEPGLDHVAEFDPSRLPVPRPSDRQRLVFKRPAPEPPAAAYVVRMEPGGDVLPENLLKIYLYFTAPMSRGEVYNRVRLVDSSGKTVESAFLEIGEELWASSGTRITLLFDPGRIKRGLRPREEEGPILEEGKTYTLLVDRQWPDASGQPMKHSFARTFRAGPADMQQPDPKSWTVKLPSASTLEPLTLTFPEPLDRAMLDRSLVLRDDKGGIVAGKANPLVDSKGWTFTPSAPWVVGPFTIDVDPELEDLAGNSVARPFEVDAEAPSTFAKPVQIKLRITAKQP